MKKIFGILAAAVIAFSFASCKGGKNEPEHSKFVIEVSEITASTAHVKVTPESDTIPYFWNVVSKDELTQSKMTLEAWAEDDMDYYPNQGYTFEELVSKGTETMDVSPLMPETEYYIYAYQFNKEFKIIGEIVSKEFKTAKLEIIGTVNLTGEAELQNLAAQMGLFAVYVDVDGTKGTYLELVFAADDINGEFTEADLDEEYGGWYVVTEDEYYPVVTANLKGAANADDTEYAFKGSVVCGNGYQYNIDVTCPMVEYDDYGAPARKIKAAKRIRR